MGSKPDLAEECCDHCGRHRQPRWALIAALAWFFFKPREAAQARVEGEVQTVDIRVKGGYAPNLIRPRAGALLRLRFDRQENSDCTARVVFPDFRASKSLPPFRTTTVELTPTEPGEYGFACGMNMLHGTLVVDPPEDGRGHDRDLQERAEQGQAVQGAPVGGGERAREDARGVTTQNRESARAVGVGPQVEAGTRCERVEPPCPVHCGRCPSTPRRPRRSCVPSAVSTPPT